MQRIIGTETSPDGEVLAIKCWPAKDMHKALAWKTHPINLLRARLGVPRIRTLEISTNVSKS